MIDIKLQNVVQGHEQFVLSFYNNGQAIEINGYQTAAEQRINIGVEQESVGYSDCDTSAGRSSSEAASWEAASKAYAVRRAVLWSVAQREYRAWETAPNIDYASLDARKAAALTRRGKRWERGHLALVEGWKPSLVCLNGATLGALELPRVAVVGPCPRWPLRAVWELGRHRLFSSS